VAVEIMKKQEERFCGLRSAHADVVSQHALFPD